MMSENTPAESTDPTQPAPSDPIFPAAQDFEGVARTLAATLQQLGARGSAELDAVARELAVMIPTWGVRAGAGDAMAAEMLGDIEANLAFRLGTLGIDGQAALERGAFGAVLALVNLARPALGAAAVVA